MGDNDEINWALRVKTRAEMRRTTAISSIRAVHNLALRTKSEPTVVPEFLANVTDLEGFWAQFKVEDDTVLDCLVESDQLENYSPDLVSEVRALINECKAISDQLSPQVFNKMNGAHSGSPSVGSPGLPNNDPQRPHSRLPEISLPRFDGEFNYWPTFRDRFTTLVDSRPFLSDIEKMYYLIGCLHGPAADVIRRIPVSADNYNVAWSTLSSRFNRPRLVASSLVDKILRASAVNQESLSELNNFLSTFSESLSLLNALKVPDMGSFLLFTIAFR